MSTRQSGQNRSTARSADRSAVASPTSKPRSTTTVASLGRAISAARDALTGLQRDDGHWCAELEGDTILESEYALALYFLSLADADKLAKLAETIRRARGADGAWSNYPGGAAEVSVSVKAYLVLKLAGDDPASAAMTEARETILRLGGLDACNSFTKIYLSIFGLYDWGRCPAVPPEMMLLPRSFYFNIYAMSSWSRAIVVPLSVIWAHKPVCSLPEGVDLDDLAGAAAVPPAPRGSFERVLWSGFFRAVNVGLQLADRFGFQPLRRRALAAAEQWMLARLEDSDGIGAIFPPIVNTLIALRCLEYPLDHPVIRSQVAELEKLEIDEGDVIRIQPCFSPVWDTAISVDALALAGIADDDAALRAGVRWLMAHEVDRPGDAQILFPEIPVGGWFFEYRNAFYPDCDDTAEVLKALSRVTFDDADEEAARHGAIARGIAWLRAMQNKDGGWAAFDKGCDRMVLTYVPFADHNAMIDPSTADITARVVEVLIHLGVDRGAAEIVQAAEFLRREQEGDGSWYGRWGCNYLYGTWLALGALAAVGDPADGARIDRAAAWLLSCQNDDGGWGELPRSYEDPATKGQGPSTAAQTAWALMGLVAAGEQHNDAVRRGLVYLLTSQADDGQWYDEHWTGTGFPMVFYLRYHLYATYFPLGALGALEQYAEALLTSAGSPARHRAA